MIIKKLTATFGGLTDKKLELGDGLNIIRGSNESGKSTWCGFIRAMLYGINTSERDTKNSIADKNRFRPWSGALMSGSMELSDTEFGNLTIERRSTSSSPLRNITVFNQSGSITELESSDIGERLLGIGGSVFERSAFISSPAFPSGDSSELEQRILSLVSIGDDSAAYLPAESTLRNWKNKLKYQRRGEIPELESQISDIEHRIEEYSKRSARLEDLTAKVKLLEEQRQALTHELEAHSVAELAEVAQRRKLAEDSFKRAEAKRIQLEKASPSASLEDLRAIERALSAEAERKKIAQSQASLLEQKRTQLNEILQKLDNFSPFLGCTPEEAETFVENDLSALRQLETRHFPVTRLFFFYLATPIICSILLFLRTNPLTALIFSLVTLSIGVSLGIWDIRHRRKKEKGALLSRISEKYGTGDTQELRQIVFRYAAIYNAALSLKQEVEEAEQALSSSKIPDKDLSLAEQLFPCVPISALPGAINHAIDLLSELDAARAEENKTRAVLAAIPEVPTVPSDSFTKKPDRTRQETERALANIDAELSSLRREAALIEGSFTDGVSPFVLEGKLTRLREALDRANIRLRAITVAMELLDSANSSLRERFSPTLNSRTAEIFSLLTGGRYDRVIVDREFSAMTGDGSSLGLHRALELSTGTAAQLYLSVRLAICESVLPREKNIPIILDDTFSSFDDARLLRALDFLYDISHHRQILLFTCHSRESEYLTGRSGVSFTDIN